MSEPDFWIGVVSKDHVDLAVADGYAQLNHGKAGPLERMHAGDGFAFYSPRSSYPSGEALRAFTAIGPHPDGHCVSGEGRRCTASARFGWTSTICPRKPRRSSR